MRFFLVFFLCFANVDLLSASESFPDDTTEHCEGMEGPDGCETIDGEGAYPEEEN